MKRTRNNKTSSIIKTVGAAVILIVLMTAVSLLVARPRKNTYEGHPIGSTYSADPGGCELMYRLFSSLGFNTYQSRKPLMEQMMPDGGVDIIWHNASDVPVAEYEIDWILEWVSDGGTLVLIDNHLKYAATDSGAYGIEKEDNLTSFFLEHFDILSGTRDIVSLGGSSDYDATPYRLPVGSRRDWELGYIDEIYTYKRHGLTNPLVYRFNVRSDESDWLKTMLKDGYGAVVVRGQYRNGQIWFISDPFLFSNMLLQDADNSLLASSIAASARGGDFSKILFDEYHLGFTQSVTLADAARTPLGRAILYICGIAVLAIAIAGARFGPVRKPYGAIGVSQRAFVNALASLWMGANAVPSAADALWRRYRSRQRVKRMGLDVELDRIRTQRLKVDELMEVARKLDG